MESTTPLTKSEHGAQILVGNQLLARFGVAVIAMAVVLSMISNALIIIEKMGGSNGKLLQPIHVQVVSPPSVYTPPQTPPPVNSPAPPSSF